MSELDIAANRESRKWTNSELLGRILWRLCTPLFRFSPRLCWSWRRFLLRRFGATIGKHVHIHPTARIYIPWNLQVGDWSSIGFDAMIYNLGPLVIGEKVTISQRVHLCGGSHDFRSPTMTLNKACITIDAGAWIAADAFIGPGITIAKSAVVGARSVVVKDVEPSAIVAGNPAQIIGRR